MGTVLVINVALHAKLFAVEHAPFPKSEPLFAEIFCDQSGTRMDKNSAESELLELGELFFEATPLKLIIPYPEWHGTISRGWIGKIRAKRTDVHVD